MARPYSLDLRDRVKQAVDEGHSHGAVAAMFRVGKATVGRYMARWRETGSLMPDKFGGYKQHRLAPCADQVRKLVEAEPDQTLAELKARLEAGKIEVSTSPIDRFLTAPGLTHEKNSDRHGTKARRRGGGARRLG